MTDSFDPWRQDVSQTLGEIKANIKFLVDAHKQGSTDLENLEKKHNDRITTLEAKQHRRDGVLGVIVLSLPFLPSLFDPLKKLFGS